MLLQPRDPFRGPVRRAGYANFLPGLSTENPRYAEGKDVSKVFAKVGSRSERSVVADVLCDCETILCRGSFVERDRSEVLPRAPRVRVSALRRLHSNCDTWSCWLLGGEDEHPGRMRCSDPWWIGGGHRTSDSVSGPVDTTRRVRA